MPQSNIQTITQFNADIKAIELFDDSTRPRRRHIPGEFDYFAVSKVSIPAVGADPVIQDDAIEFSTDGQRYFKAPRGMRFRLPQPTRDLWVKLSDAYSDECTVEVLCGRGDVADFRWVYNGEILSVSIDAHSDTVPLPVRDYHSGIIRPGTPSPSLNGTNSFYDKALAAFPKQYVTQLENVYGLSISRAIARVRTVGVNLDRFGFTAVDSTNSNKVWLADFPATVALAPGDTLELPCPLWIFPGQDLNFEIAGAGAAGWAFDVSLVVNRMSSEIV